MIGNVILCGSLFPLHAEDMGGYMGIWCEYLIPAFPRGWGVFMGIGRGQGKMFTQYLLNELFL